ncbi:MAG: hypothetical protein Q8S73_07155 [Deltaproteobacteria bacterium]|nr:hypothetical protein [Myxococcales bacterium]MDP3213864.1 hypothetical protein [Deltaproteobacteria bacterium]
MRARWIVLALCFCLVGALLALRPSPVDAQHTGGSFGGSRWGSGGGGSPAPTKTWGQKTGGVSRPSSWGSTYDPDRNRRPRYNGGSQGGGGECAASLAMMTIGLVGGLVVGRRERRKRP